MIEILSHPTLTQMLLIFAVVLLIVIGCKLAESFILFCEAEQDMTQSVKKKEASNEVNHRE